MFDLSGRLGEVIHRQLICLWNYARVRISGEYRGYNSFNTDIFSLKMDYNGVISAMKFYSNADAPIKVDCHPDSGRFFMFFQ